MKSGWKVFWIVCGIVFGAGVILCLAGRMMGATLGDISDDLTIQIFDDESVSVDSDFDYGHRTEAPDSAEVYSGVTELEVDVTGVVLQILPSEDDKIHVETKGVDSRLDYSCKQEEHTLKIETTDDLHLINRIKNTTATIWVCLPQGQLEEIDISNKAGAVYVEQAEAVEISLDVGAGEAVFTDFTAQKAELVCGAGQITGTGTILNEAELECGVGEIDLTLNGKETDYNCAVSCGVGEVNVGELQFSGIGIDQYKQYEGHHEGHHEEEHYGEYYGSRMLSINCSVGSVTVSFTD